MNHIIDAVTILAVLGCYAEGKVVLTHAEIARYKESDRLSAITKSLKKMGANIEEAPDGLVIYQSNLNGAVIDSQADHRIALSIATAGLGAAGETVIENIECIDKSYPDFISSMRNLGAELL